MTILYDSTNMSRLVTILWYDLIQFYKSQTCLDLSRDFFDLSKAIRWWNTIKYERLRARFVAEVCLPKNYLGIKLYKNQS